MGLGKEVILDKEGSTAIITINRPEKLNSLTHDVLDGFEEAFYKIDADASLRCAIITGAGTRAFTAGIDISTFTGGYEDTRSFVLRELTVLYDRTVRLPIPMIAAIEGFAYATGCEYTVCCDIVYASESARFCFPDLNLGIIPAAAAWKTVDKMNRMKMTKLMFTAEEFSASTAAEIGLVTEVVPAGTALAAAKRTAAIIGEKAPMSVRALKKALNKDFGMDWLDSLECEGPLFASEDFQEGSKAFLEKRAPKWGDR